MLNDCGWDAAGIVKYSIFLKQNNGDTRTLLKITFSCTF